MSDLMQMIADRMMEIVGPRIKALRDENQRLSDEYTSVHDYQKRQIRGWVNIAHAMGFESDGDFDPADFPDWQVERIKKFRARNGCPETGPLSLAARPSQSDEGERRE